MFGLESTASAIVFKTIDLPLSAVTEPLFAAASLTHFTGIKQKPGVDTHHLAILLIGLAVGSQGIPEIVDRVSLLPISLLIRVICTVFISLRLRIFFYQYLNSYLLLRQDWSRTLVYCC